MLVSLLSRGVLVALVLLIGLGSTASTLAAQDLPGNLPLASRADHPRLDPLLNDFARASRTGRTSALAAVDAAGDLVHRLGDKVAVTIRYPDRLSTDVRSFLTRRGAVVATTLPGSTDAYVAAEDLAALDGLSPDIRVTAIVKPAGLFVSQGPAVHNSTRWNTLGYRGQGIKIGVIDTGFTGLLALRGTEVPATMQARCYRQVGVPTGILANCEPAGDRHGTAVVESIFDIAPEAQYYVSNAMSNADKQSTVAWMVANGVHVINFSQGWLWDGPGNGTSVYADSPLRSVDMAVNGGAVFVAAAGNHNELTWSGGFVDADADGWAEFAPGVELNAVAVVAPAIAFQLRWPDNWGGATRDLEIVLFDQSLNVIGQSLIPQDGTAMSVPFDTIVGTLTTTGVYYLAVRRVAGTAPASFQLQAFSHQAVSEIGRITNSGSISNPAESANPGMLTVGAAAWSSTSTIEPYSSRGPTPDGRIKPDIVGAARADSVALGEPFGGTSQAAPFVSGLVALVRQRYPSATTSQVVTIMKAWAQPRLSPVPNTFWGYGFARLPDDADGDGLDDQWELLSGLNFNSGAGLDGGGGDPDGDGRTNAQEAASHTHPRGFVKRYLAEGVSNAFFSTQIALLNPSATAYAYVLLRLQPESGGAESSVSLVVPPRTRRTVGPATLGGMRTSYATLIESDIAVVVDRTVTWDASGYGSHSEGSLPAASNTWFLAEGATGGPFDLFYLLQNSGDTPSTVQVTFLRPAPAPPLVKSYVVAPRSRRTIAVDGERFPDVTGPTLLDGGDVSAAFRVLSGPPVIVERAMYFSRPGRAFEGGHQSAGVTAPATRWFLAEGATGGFFDLFVLIANPTATAAQVRLTYLTRTGQTFARTLTLAANSRQTIWVDQEVIGGTRPVADAEVSTTVESLNGVGIVVERAMWWPEGNWYEGHNAAGATTSGPRWAMAEGEAGGASGVQTYVLLANVGTGAVTARVTALTESGAAISWVTPSIPASSRLTVPMQASQFPGLDGQKFGVVVECLTSGGQLVVERAMYTSGGGTFWGAGTAALAQPLP